MWQAGKHTRILIGNCLLCIRRRHVKSGHVAGKTNHDPLVAQVAFPVPGARIDHHELTGVGHNGFVPDVEFAGTAEAEEYFPEIMGMGKAVPAALGQENGGVMQRGSAVGSAAGGFVAGKHSHHLPRYSDYG